ncbi:hypothetical protein [Psychromonas sp. SP041]|uniref:hypothetical protein n=1 Tax=Psychromonas sp. SP041 TaxID=1365007 RepID=UPI0010C7DD92|nr:hypothetical protein [Psychromonas sp. SP041]
MILEQILSGSVPADLVQKCNKDYLFLYFVSSQNTNEIDREAILGMDSHLLAPAEEQKKYLNDFFEELKAKISSAPNQEEEEEQITL